MMKFEALQRIQDEQQKAKWREQGLESDGEEKEPLEELPADCLRKLFEETAMFTVADVVEPEPVIQDQYYVDEYGYWEFENDAMPDDDGNWDEEDDDTSEDDHESKRDPSVRVKREARRPKSIKNIKAQVRTSSGYTQYNDNFNSYSKTPCNLGPEDVRYVRCPNHPMVASFCYNFIPYKESTPTSYPEADIVHGNISQMLEGNKVYGIYLNFPWVYADVDHMRTKKLWGIFRDFQITDALMEMGLIFVYIPKFLFDDATEMMTKKGFKWVEKAIVIQRKFGLMETKKSRFLDVAVMSLHIFRKKTKGRLPMQHQRVTNARLLTGEDKMYYTYDLIEQMLPPTHQGQKNVKLLELYDIGEKREGWIQIRHKDQV